MFYCRKRDSLSPRTGKVSQAYYTQDVIRCRCKSVQKSIHLKNAGIVPPPYEVSSAYTEPLEPSSIDLTDHSGKGDCTNNRVLNKSFRKCKRSRRRKCIPTCWDSLSQTHRDTKSLESMSCPSEASEKTSVKKFKRKTIADYDCDSKKCVHNSNPKKIVRGKRVHFIKYSNDVASKDISTSKARNISLTKLHRKRNFVTSPAKGRCEYPWCKCSKNNLLVKETTNDMNRHMSSFTKKNTDSPFVICKCVDEKPNIRFEILPKSARDKNDKIRQISNETCKKGLCRNDFLSSKSFDCARNDNNMVKHSRKYYLKGSGDVPELCTKRNCESACACDELDNTETSKVYKTTIHKNETDDKSICFIAPRQINNKYILRKCYKRSLNTKPTECTEKTCNIPRKSTSTVRIKDKIICLCHKYSQRIREKNRKFGNKNNIDTTAICEGSLQRHMLGKRKNIKTRTVNESAGQPCSLSRKMSNYLNRKKSTLQTTQLPTITTEQKQQTPCLACETRNNKDSKYKCFYRCLKSKCTIKFDNKNPIDMAAAQKTLCHGIDQTGEPFFEIRVDANKMCVLNSDEIKNKVTALGTSKKVNSCICPSHNSEKKRFLQKVACSTGVCENAYRKENTNFKCKCLSNTTRKCSDVTFDVALNAKSLPIQQNKPYLELRLDSDNLCILNSDDIQRKINLMGTACNIGICKDASDKNIRFNCTSVQRKATEFNECTDETCDKLKIQNKLSNRMVSCKLVTRQLNSMNSKLCFICDRIKSKSRKCTNGIKNRTITDAQSDVVHDNKCAQMCVKEKFSDDQIDKAAGEELSTNNRNDRQKHISNDDDLTCPKIITCACCQCNKRTKTWLFKSLFSCNKHKNVKNRTNIRRKNIHKRNGLSLPSITKKSEVKDDCRFCCVCGEQKSNCGCIYSPKTVRRKRMFCNSCLALIKIYRKNNKKPKLNYSAPLSKVKEKNQLRLENEGQKRDYYKQNHRNIKKCFCFEINKSDLKSGKNVLIMKRNQPERSYRHKKMNENICLCSHICKCGVKKGNKQLFKLKNNNKTSNNKVKQHKLQKRKHRKQRKRNQRVARDKQKALLTDEKKIQRQLKKKENIERKKKEKRFKTEKKQLEAISKGKEQAEETSCLADFFLGLLKCGVTIVKKVMLVFFKIVTNPKGSYKYARQRIRDPGGTYERLRKSFTDSWRIRKLKMLRSIGGSEKMTVLSDTLQDTAIFQAFADKGKTKKEKKRIQEQNKKRKWRIQKRNTEALHGCRHMFLHTMRKHPCLWVYHVCPNFYPQCLSLVAFMKHFFAILLFMLALIVWTPCILCVEVARGFMCCLLCTH